MGKSSNFSDVKRRLGERYPGELSLIKLSNEEINDFIDYMSITYKGNYLDYLYSIIGKDKILLYVETLENMTIRIPPRKTTAKVIFYIRVYNYLKSRNFSDEAYKSASRVFMRRVFDLKRIVSKVQTVLERYNENEKL